MTDSEQPVPSDGQLREEAAAWWAAMHGEQADALRPDFEAWLNRGSYHRSAYNRMGEIHAFGKHLKEESDLAAPLPPTANKSGRGKNAAATAIFACGLLIGGLSYRQATMQALLPPVQDESGSKAPFQRIATQALSTRIGEVRTIGLSDGTRVILDTDSLMSVSFQPDVRTVRLERGRARITIGADPRPFKLMVGDRSVDATHATLDAEKRNMSTTAVHVVAGDASVTQSGDKTEGVPLAAGQSAAIDATAPTIRPIAEPTSSWPTGVIDVDRMTLGDLIAASNRYSKSQIVLGTADLSALKVSGRFRINDTASLARRLALLFNLQLDTSTSERIILHM
ncbi:FecR domain-containing protein [Sphingomonas sp. CGMCC 1.13654]|uniref:FecR domain-containing protein n=1 Tax=Sphingomonas chungangi TaxID=2683589 RepID=A0A838L910_9SPHN|nr:FecR domain-containing protein [Sphingomonas chungangi]MBA2934626.1 FecR domain-containing protein [Sphingomonas chungangi]MVW57662.1 DUF4880 domain-containing protein [Sphingomonas chungangi]